MKTANYRKATPDELAEENRRMDEAAGLAHADTFGPAADQQYLSGIGSYFDESTQDARDQLTVLGHKVCSLEHDGNSMVMVGVGIATVLKAKGFDQPEEAAAAVITSADQAYCTDGV